MLPDIYDSTWWCMMATKESNVPFSRRDNMIFKLKTTLGTLNAGLLLLLYLLPGIYRYMASACSVLGNRRKQYPLKIERSSWEVAIATWAICAQRAQLYSVSCGVRKLLVSSWCVPTLIACPEEPFPDLTSQSDYESDPRVACVTTSFAKGVRKLWNVWSRFGDALRLLYVE